MFSRFLTLTLALALGAAHAAPAPYPPDADRVVSPGDTTYFIDPAGGDDSLSGTDRKGAWKSFGPLNRLRLSAGDRVEIVAPGSFDQTLLLTGGGTAEKPVEVRFAPGRYDFSPTHAYREAYQISNTNAESENPKAVAILLRNAKHVKVSGAGADVVLRGKMIEVCIDGSEDITISGLSFDYHRPTVSEYSVAAQGEGFVDLKIHPDTPCTIDDGKITWRGEGWSHQDGLTQELDLATNEVWRRRDPLKGLRMEEIEPNLIRAHGKTDLKPGRIYQVRDTNRDCAGVFVRRSKGITWKDVHFRFIHGMGLVHQFSENLTFDSVIIAPNPPSGRTTASWADAIHISGCRGKVLVKNCRFSGTHDDAINIHGTYLRVVERTPDGQIKVRFMHPQTFGFMAFNPGDEVEFIRTDSLATYGANRILEATMLNPQEIILKLEKPFPADFHEGDALENVTWNPEVEIRGCKLERIPTRGFLLTTRGKVLVEDNDFLATRMSAIYVENGAEGWFESGCVRDMTIRGNRFVRCAEPVINISPKNTIPNDAVHENIRIEGNEFELRSSSSLKAKGTKGLSFKNNTIRSTRPLGDADTIKTDQCSDLIIENNTYKTSDPETK
jgi:hypothetical protein